jgi:ribonucleotide monophosphatase NagD (HAD superfamily)
LQSRKRKAAGKKKKKVVQVFGDPSDKDIMMAKAYGGVPRGAPKRVLPKTT